MLAILLRGWQPIVKAVERAIGAPRLPPAERRALDEGADHRLGVLQR